MARSTLKFGTLLLVALLFASSDYFAASAADVAAPATAPATQPMATLTIRVTDLRNHKGQLLFGVFRSADGFPKEQAKSVAWQIKAINADAVVFTSTLPPGKYAASVLHDENKNGKMDMNFLGIPEEGYGVTNNPKPDFRQARFDEAIFNLPPQGATLTISIQYF
jgi:uncharacterized protein (DUF2141 family)